MPFVLGGDTRAVPFTLHKYPIRDAMLLLMAAFIVSVSTHAQTYPAKSMRLVSPYPPGSSADVIGRICAPKLAETFGRQFIMDNRAGAAGNIAGELVARTMQRVRPYFIEICP